MSEPAPGKKGFPAGKNVRHTKAMFHVKQNDGVTAKPCFT